MKAERPFAPDNYPKREKPNLTFKELSKSDIDQIMEVENNSFEEYLRADEQTILNRLELGHQIIGAYDGGKLVGLVSFSYNHVDPQDLLELPLTAREFSQQPTAENPNCAFVYNLSLLPDYRRENNADEILKTFINKCQNDELPLIVAEGRIPSYNGCDSDIEGRIKKNEALHAAIDESLASNTLPSEQILINDPLLRYYKTFVHRLGLKMTPLRLIPHFSPGDIPSGEMRLLFKIEKEDEKKSS